MSESDQHGIPPDSTVRRAIENLTRRAVWTGETTRCDNCDSEVELDSGHYYVTIREESADGESNSRDAVFCTRSCAVEYFRS